MDEDSTSARSAANSLPARPTLATKEPSQEELEVAQSLQEHAKSARNMQIQQPTQQIRKSLSPFEDRTSPASTSSLSGEVYDVVGSDREQSYAPTIAGSDTAPSGQVCS